MSRVLSCYLIGVSLQKGVVAKSFPSCHPEYLWVCREPSFSASCNFWKGVCETMFQKVFQVIIQYIYGFLFWGLQRTPLSLHPTIFEKGLWNHTSKCFPSYHPIYLWVFILGFAENPSFSASYNLWKGVCETMFQKVFQLINQYIYGFLLMGLQRTPLSLHPTIFEKMSLTLLTKRFSNLSTKIFMGFYFQSCRERV